MVVSGHYPLISERTPMPAKEAMVSTNLRIPKSLYEQIKDAAENDERSVNAEMIVLLREALYERARRTPPTTPDSPSDQ